MAQGFPGAKLCPQCGKSAVIDALQCSGCGHVYRTKFPPPQPLNQTIGFPGIPMPGVQPPPGINPQNIINVPMSQPKPTGAWASLSPWAQWGIALGGMMFLFVFGAVALVVSTGIKRETTQSNSLPLPCSSMSDPGPCDLAAFLNIDKINSRMSTATSILGDPTHQLIYPMELMGSKITVRKYLWVRDSSDTATEAFFANGAFVSLENGPLNTLFKSGYQPYHKDPLAYW